MYVIYFSKTSLASFFCSSLIIFSTPFQCLKLSSWMIYNNIIPKRSFFANSQAYFIASKNSSDSSTYTKRYSFNFLEFIFLGINPPSNFMHNKTKDKSKKH